VSGATSYKIYRGVSASWTPSETPATSASYTFTGLDSNTTYYFRITAINSNGESSQSSAVSAKTQAPPLQKPNAPYGSPVITAQTTNSLTLGWNASSNATGYKLYRATGDSNSFTVVYTGSARTYTNSGLTSGVTYKYKVTATNSAGESEFSDTLTYRKL
jgi:cellulose 1,4-beta-cellobiosidase